MDIPLGWFDEPGPAPAFDPGLRVSCPVCGLPLVWEPRTTVSLMGLTSTRSYFFRAHRSCWRYAPPETRAAIESAVIDTHHGGEAAGQAPR